MKTNHRILIALVAAAIGVAIALQFASDPYIGTTSQTVSQAIVQGQDDALFRAESLEKGANAREATALLDGHSTEKLLEVLEASHRPAGEAAYVRLQISQLCDESQLLGSDRPRTESTRALAAFRTSFCGGRSPSVESAQQELLSLPADDPYVLAYGLSSELFDAAAVGSGNANNVASIANELGKIMLSPGSGLDAVVAAEALQATGLISPRMLALGNSSGWSLTPSELSDAQLLGVQMNACVKFGGCGPNQLVTMKVCSEVSNCELGLDAHGVWRKRYSPSVYAAGKAFADSIAEK